MKKGDGNMKRIYFDAADLEGDMCNIIEKHNKLPRITAKIKKGVVMYTVTF